MRAPSIRIALASALVIAITSCGGATGKRARGTGPGTSAVCVADANPEACLRFLDRVVRVRSVTLTAHVPAQVTASCASAARSTHIDVVCPPLLPRGGVVNDPELYGPQIVNRRSYSVSINNGQNPGHIHWEFGAIKGPATQLWVFDRSNWAAPPATPAARRIGYRRYLGHRITLFRFPDNDGQLEGHDAAFATQDGVSYFVSIHGHTHDDADIAMLLAILLARHA